jgi:hypothetical protein
MPVTIKPSSGAGSVTLEAQTGISSNFTLTLPGVSGTVSTQASSFTTGSVLFANSGGQVAQDNTNLFWDDSNNRLGIGTASPAQRLDISTPGGGGFRVSAANYPQLIINNTTGTTWKGSLAFQANGSGKWEVGADISNNGTNNFFFFDAAAATTRLFIDGSGNVGVGLTTPSYPLEVYNASTAADYYAGRFWSVAAGSGTSITHLRIEKSSGFGGTVGGYLSQGVGSGLVFSTLNGGTLSYAMWINNSGNVGIGTASINAKLQFVNIVGSAGGANMIRLYEAGSSIFGFGVAAGELGYRGAAHVFYNDTGTEYARIDSSNNMLLGTTTSPTSGTQCLTIETGTAATASPADTVTIYSTDRSAGNTIPSFYCEGAGVTNAGITNVTVTHKIAMRVNGTIYYLLATTNAT